MILAGIMLRNRSWFAAVICLHVELFAVDGACDSAMLYGW